MAVYRLTPAASRDLFAIYVQSDDLFGPRQALAYHNELKDIFRRLADHPQMTRLRLEYDPPVHVFTFKAHVVVYEVEASGDVTILRVRHGHEDWTGQAGDTAD